MKKAPRMFNHDIMLSAGVIPWLGIKQALNYVKDVGYDGLELLPVRKAVVELNEAIKIYGKDDWIKGFSDINLIKGLHQSWRLDMGLDKNYGINSFISFLFSMIRRIFFPKTSESERFIEDISETLNKPVTTHDISDKWTKGGSNKEFSGGINYEILGLRAKTPQEIKHWLKGRRHFIIIDTRDDQSLLWANKYNFKSWKDFWSWIGIKKINSLQLTLIGINGISKIIRHKKCLAEQQLLWLHEKKWRGSVTVEVNPLALFLVCKGDIKKGLKIIASFIRKTLDKGESWSGFKS